MYVAFHSSHVAKYCKIEEELLEEFKRAYNRGEIENMAKCANALLPFKVCAFICWSQFPYHEMIIIMVERV